MWDFGADSDHKSRGLNMTTEREESSKVWENQLRTNFNTRNQDQNPKDSSSDSMGSENDHDSRSQKEQVQAAWYAPISITLSSKKSLMITKSNTTWKKRRTNRPSPVIVGKKTLSMY